MSKSSRHLRIHYSVQPPYEADLWWVRKLRRWLPLNDPAAKDMEKTNSRRFRTKTKAFRYCDACPDLPKGSIVVRLNPHCGWRRKLGHGTWEITEWFKGERPKY